MPKDRITELEKNKTSQGGGQELSNESPLMNGAPTPGTSIKASRADHIHPSDNSKVNKTGDSMSGSLIFPTSINTDVGVKTAIVTGETTATTRQRAKAHSIEMGVPNRDYMNFNEYGGEFRFYKTNEVYDKETPADGKLLARIDSDGNFRLPEGAMVAPNGTSPIYMLPKIPYQELDPTHTTEIYFSELLKWICRNYPNVGPAIWIGIVQPNSQGTAIIQIYDTAKVNSAGLPEYSSGLWININRSIYYFGTMSYNFIDKSM